MRQFVESMRRLYSGEMISEKKVVELFENGKITEEELEYILNAR